MIAIAELIALSKLERTFGPKILAQFIVLKL
jgi:hypothetical protein